MEIDYFSCFLSILRLVPGRALIMYAVPGCCMTIKGFSKYIHLRVINSEAKYTLLNFMYLGSSHKYSEDIVIIVYHIS